MFREIYDKKNCEGKSVDNIGTKIAMEIAVKIAMGIVIPIVIPIVIFLFSNWYKSEQERKNRRKAVFCSLASEIASLRELIQNRLDLVANLKDDEKPFVYIPINQNYFSVYDSVVKELSVLDSDKLIKEIIHTYMETKGLFDDVIGLSNSCLDIKSFVYKEGITPESLGTMSQSQLQYFDAVVERVHFVLDSLDNLMRIIEKERENIK